MVAGEGAENAICELDFLTQCEINLLSIDSTSSLLAQADCPRGESPQSEYSALIGLLAASRAGDLPGVLAAPWLEPLARVLARASVESALDMGIPVLRSRLRSGCNAFIGAAPTGVADVRRCGLLAVAVSSLHLYMRANWTGPAVDDVGPFCLADSYFSSAANRRILEALEVDGEPAYELLLGAGYLWLALELLDVFPSHNLDAGAGPLVSGITYPIWRGRAAFAWQLSLAEASDRGFGQSPRLFQLSICDMVGEAERAGVLSGSGLITGEALATLHKATAPVLKSWRSGAAVSIEQSVAVTRDGASAAVVAAKAIAAAPDVIRTALLVELAVRLCWYGRTKGFDGVLAAACAGIGFDFEVTGVLGIKREYQTQEFAQLMVKAGTGADINAQQGGHTRDSIAGLSERGSTPGNLKLKEIDDMTDVLEGPKVSSSVAEDDRAKLEEPLTSIEQLILLAKCHQVWVSSNPNDEMTLQEINALAQRVLATHQMAKEVSAADGPLFTSNWVNFSCGLWYRCKAEHHRNKTRERAAFQLQSLVDQFNDEKPSAAHRLLVVHSSGYPARFHLQREMGTRMMRMGMVSTAHEQFKKLRMWPEAIDCLMVAERNVEAQDMVKELLAEHPTPRLWCCLGDLEKEPKHFETAWELSGKRFARAQRSLGRHYFSKGELEKAVDSFRLALDVNPLHSGIWFTMGVAQMRLQRWEDAVFTFSRCVGIEDENSEAWANLAAVHSARGNLREARTCMSEACRRQRESWKMWESFMGICMQLRDIQGVIQALRRLAELDQGARIQERIVGMVAMAVVSDAQGLYEGRTGQSFSGQLDSLFKFMTEKCSSRAFVWRFWAELQDSRGERHEALQSRLRQHRVAQAQLWDERDPERFTVKLEDLRECQEVIAGTLEEPLFVEVAKEQLQPFAYSVRDTARRLETKLDTGLQAPAEWKKELATISALAVQLESCSTAGMV
mmetsp:Transcript_30003/g.75677  ORF Transcript_30003/g.75677 Transcript_30003/m.75677 type:complete len:960 (+) Transcript_30003:97-2976(+)